MEAGQEVGSVPFPDSKLTLLVAGSQLTGSETLVLLKGHWYLEREVEAVVSESSEIAGEVEEKMLELSE